MDVSTFESIVWLEVIVSFLIAARVSGLPLEKECSDTCWKGSHVRCSG